LQAGGRGFESLKVHHIELIASLGALFDVLMK